VAPSGGIGDLVIRQYKPADQAQIRALHDRTAPNGGPATTPQRWPPDLDRIRQNYLAFWVAVERDESGEQTVGMAGVERAGDDVPEPVLRGRSDVARLKRMRVAPERQRRGIGLRLTETAIAWAREHAFHTLLLETTTEQTAAIALYQRAGFTEVGRSMLGPFALVWFERPLAGANRSQ